MNIKIPVFIILVALLVMPMAAQENAPAKAAGPALESTGFIQSLCKKMESPNARLRFAVREALVIMGKQTLPVLNAAKAESKNVHLNAFITRTIARVKSMKTTRGRTYSTLRSRDIDRLAMNANLTLEQITQILPILAKYDKNRKELYAEFREAGGYQDKEAYKDLQEELKLMVEEAVPDLKKYLNEKQVKTVTSQIRGGGFGGGRGVRMIGGPGGGGITIIRPKSKKK